MPKIELETYEITAKIIVRKDYWEEENGKIKEKVVAEKIGQGLEVPTESITVKIVR